MNQCSSVILRRCTRQNGCLPTAHSHSLQDLQRSNAYAFQLRARGLSKSPVVTASVDGGNGKSTTKKRGPKKTIISIDDLPQGMISTESAADEPAEEPESTISYPTVIQQARDNMSKFPDCVVLTRVGNFYELYFHQAQYWGAQLNIKVASKRVGSKKTGSTAVPMAGFPFFQLERYLKILVKEHGMHVAIAEEKVNDPSQKIKSGGLLFDRQVRRIITPGTLIDENFLSPNEHNWLLGIRDSSNLGCGGTVNEDTTDSPRDRKLHLSWIDLSSGDFCIQETSATELPSAISRIAPGEIVADTALQNDPDEGFRTAISESGKKVTFRSDDGKNSATERLSSAVEGVVSTNIANDMSSRELASAEMLLGYVQEQLPGLKLRLQPPMRYESKEHLSIDKNTLRGLEILQTMKDGGYAGSLLHAARRTSTRSGARLLSQRLTAPSMSLSIIEDRLNLVQSLRSIPDLLDQITTLLRKTTDSLRLVQSLACGKGSAQDLLSLARTISLTRRVGNLLAQNSEHYPPLEDLTDRFQWDGPAQLASRILEAIDEDALMAQYRSQEDAVAEAAGIARAAIAAEDAADVAALQKRFNSARVARTASSEDADEDDEGHASDDNWVMRRDASVTLASLHERLEDLRRHERDLARSLQDQLNAKSLSLKWTPSLGHIVHVKGKDTKSDPSQILPGARTVGSSKSTRSFWLPAWTTLGARLEEAKVRIRGEEQQIFRSLRGDVCANIVALRCNANILDELDVGCGSAILADECNLVRPVLDESTSMQIVGGRHVTVEAGLKAKGRSFTPNDCSIGLPRALSTSMTTRLASDGHSGQQAIESIHLITGPNMAGKSTYLRQTALIAILAQTGMYVPASYARLGLVDAVFSRIGSADNLYQDQSTFMVEMLETAEILRHAGKRSLVVMDEVGRGTSPEDGVAVGYAVLERLRRKGVGRLMFATHFHKVLDLCREWPEVGCYCTRLVEEPAVGSGRAGRGSFRFDHKMRRGVNRDSHALKVARLAGVSLDVIGLAEEVLTKLKRKEEG